MLSIARFPLSDIEPNLSVIPVAAVSHRVRNIFPFSTGIGAVVVSLKGPSSAIAHATRHMVSYHQHQKHRRTNKRKYTQ